MNNYDLFSDSLAILASAAAKGIVLLPMPDHGPEMVREIVETTPDGHYFQFGGAAGSARVFCVGSAERRADEVYADLVPGFEFVLLHFLPVLGGDGKRRESERYAMFIYIRSNISEPEKISLRASIKDHLTNWKPEVI